MLFVVSLLSALKQKFNELINGKSQTNKDQKSNLLFLQRHNQSQKLRFELVKKIDKKHYKGNDLYYIEYIKIKKLGDFENIHSVNLFYFLVNYASGYI